MVKWMSIPNFHSLRRSLDLYAEKTPGFELPVINYRAKVKLHGTNAGVHIKPSGQVIAQSRDRFITPGDDNYGFAKWVDENEGYFASLAINRNPVTIYGEWCGPGVMKGTAINQIEHKSFAVFSALSEADGLLTEPMVLDHHLRNFADPPSGIHALPWVEFWVGAPNALRIDFSDTGQIMLVAADMDDMVAAVEVEDPWVKAQFGISGMGEGLVFYPQNFGTDEEMISHYIFKAKGKKHAVVKQKTPVQIDPEAAKSIEEFVTMVVTDQRLEQGLEEACKGKLEMKMLGPFLAWVGKDIKKECQAELEAAGLVWKDVGKVVSSAARTWLIAKVEAI